MRVSVGPLVYTVKLVAGYILHEGEECLGLCDNEAQELYVSDRTTPAQRVAVFCHEYMEAWVYHFGGGEKSKEGYCDLFGLAMAQFVQQFAPGFEVTGERVGPEEVAEAGLLGDGVRVTEKIVPGDAGDGRSWRIRVIEPPGHRDDAPASHR